jgi:hypothetical protein
MIRTMMLAAALAALAACAKKEEVPAAATPAAAPPAAEGPAPVDAAAQPIGGDPASAWVEMIGVWAPEGGCGDYTQEWRLEAEAFHLHETHCKIERLEMLANGVRAIARCSVEGDDDRVEDVFSFVRRENATLSIIIEANGAANDGLVACSADMIP